MRVTNITATWMVCAALVAPVFAEESAAPQAEPETAPAAANAPQPPAPTFRYRSGDIVLPNNVATLHLAERYRYLDPSETNKLLMAWGNESDPSTQGAIVALDVDPMTDAGWAVILTYEKEGHIDDSDAAKMDYDDMLKDMKEGTEDNNAARKEAGFGAVHLIGWAERPHYDAAMKKLYWAKELQFEGASARTLNYDVRVLGREGVLSMNAVSIMPQIEQIRADMKPLIEVAEFNPGYRYAEFNSKTDRLAEYGLGALIAGGVAAKLGLFAKLGALLLAFKKVLIVALIAIGGFLKRLFGGKKDVAT